MAAHFAINSIIALQLDSRFFHGWLFCLNKAALSIDDLMLGKIVAHRVGADMNQLVVLQQQRQAAVVDNKLRVARDLHDGLLQSLTGIALQLHSVHRHMDGTDPAYQDIQGVRSLPLS